MAVMTSLRLHPLAAAIKNALWWHQVASLYVASGQTGATIRTY